MKTNFVWTDLSTFQVDAAVSFYRSVLGWDVSGEAGYMNCSAQGSPCAGIYEMPEFFQSIRMPSFWMTYVSVDDAAATAARAAELGGKVELEEETPRGRVALIRDPAGAGFTCYEGKELSANRDSSIPGNWCWSELMVSDINLVREFYEGIFGWKFRSAGHDRYSIITSSGEEIGAVQVAENEVKGNKEFWAVYFAGDDLERVSASILDAGGSIEGIYEHEEGRQLLAYDSQGAAFFLLERITGATHSPVSAAPVVSSGKRRWRSLVGLVAIYGIILFEQDWAWGALFLFWALPDLKSGTTYFIEPLSRRENPGLYWGVVLTWIALALYLLVEAFFTTPAGT